MQTLTPMKQYKDILNNFETILENNFNITKLNKASKKYNPYARYDEKSSTKGVESDFIIIFKNKAKGKYFTVDSGESSFAFAFNYIELNKEEFSVEVSIKINNVIKSTKKISVKEFILEIKEITKNKDKFLENPFDNINKIFFKAEYSLEKELNQTFKDILEFKEKNKEELKILKEKEEKLKNELTKNMQKADKELSKCKEAKELKEAEKFFLIAKKNFDNKQYEILTNNNIEKLKKEYLKASNSVKLKIKNDEEQEKKIISKLPKKAQKQQR